MSPEDEDNAVKQFFFSLGIIPDPMPTTIQEAAALIKCIMEHLASKSNDE